MKRINLYQLSDERPTEVSDALKAWLVNAPDDDGRGLSPATMRKRFKIVDAIEEAVASGQDYVDLEDEHHGVLSRAANNVRFNVGDRTILQIMDRIEKAEAPPKPVKES